MGTVMAVCVSKEKGTQKTRVDAGVFRSGYGIEGDAHAGSWHRQVSILPYEQIEAFKERGARVEDGAFGENLVVQGIDRSLIQIGTRLCCNDVVLEVTQIGKKCHHGCRIYQEMGECIMPGEGIFLQVLQGGVIRPGDEMRIEE